MEQFINKLTQQLALPLPGEVAFQKMSIPSRSIWKPNEKTRKSAVLILFYKHLNDIYIPLILRPKYDGVHAGQMAFPGGRFENSDENLIRTAVREAQEEIGIKASDVKVIGQLTEIYIAPSNFLALPIVGYLPYRPDFYPDPREVDKIFEINLKEFLNTDNISTTTIKIKDFSLEVPCYIIQNNIIWGATALMISELNYTIGNIGFFE